MDLECYGLRSSTTLGSLSSISVSPAFLIRFSLMKESSAPELINGQWKNVMYPQKGSWENHKRGRVAGRGCAHQHYCVRYQA